MRRSVRVVSLVALPWLLAGLSCSGPATDDPGSPGGSSGQAGSGGSASGGQGVSQAGAGGGSGGQGGSQTGGSGSGGQDGSQAGAGGAQAGAGGSAPGGEGGSGAGAGGSAGQPGGSGGNVMGGAGGDPDPGNPPADAGAGPGATSSFSFFVTSLKALQVLSGNENGFGGDLRFGKADGLSGADEICRQAAEMGMPGAGQKTWRAFLSVTSGPEGGPVHARDRIGPGPWYDRNGRLVARDLEGLFAGERPAGDPMIVSDLPNERGEPNHHVGPNGYSASMVFDNHDTITASDTQGRLRADDAADTCNDWTSTTATGRPYCGHSWPRSPRSGRQWASDHRVGNCRPGIDRTLGGTGSTIGTSGGYGGFYCFALAQ